MQNRLHRPLMLSLLACWLTLAGSGDDFNVLRAALAPPVSSAPVGSLPLDDGNTDFVQPSTGDQATQPMKRASWAETSPTRASALPSWATPSSNSHPSPQPDADSAKPRTPLRC